MRVKVFVPAEDIDQLREKLLEGVEKVESDKKGENEWEGVGYLIIYDDEK